MDVQEFKELLNKSFVFRKIDVVEREKDYIILCWVPDGVVLDSNDIETLFAIDHLLLSDLIIEVRQGFLCIKMILPKNKEVSK